MQVLYYELQALATRLAVQGTDLNLSYEVPGYGTLGDLKPSGHEVVDLGEGWGQRIALQFACRGNGTLELHCETKVEHERRTELFASHGLRFSWRSIANWRWITTMEAFVPVRIEFTGDPATKKLRLCVKNVDRLGEAKISYRPAAVNGELLGELEKWILRRANRFRELSGFTVSDDTLSMLRDKISQHKEERKRELAANSRK